MLRVEGNVEFIQWHIPIDKYQGNVIVEFIHSIVSSSRSSWHFASFLYKFHYFYGLNCIPPWKKLIYWSPNSPYDGIWSWHLWEGIWFKRGHTVGLDCDGINILIKVSTGGGWILQTYCQAKEVRCNRVNMYYTASFMGNSKTGKLINGIKNIIVLITGWGMWWWSRQRDLYDIVKI